MSQGADRAPAENLRCVHPGRYRCETSIAYRLALVAAGEAEACSALEGVGDWDYCGGHALVLGAIDRRVKCVLLTPAGVALRKRLEERLATDHPAVRGLSPSQQAALADLLRSMRA